MKAVCVLQEGDGSGVKGTITFEQESADSPTTITAEVSGLSEGELEKQNVFHSINFRRKTWIPYPCIW